MLGRLRATGLARQRSVIYGLRPPRSPFPRRQGAYRFDDKFELLGDLHRGFDGARAPRDASDHVHVISLGDLDAVAELSGGAVGARATEDAGGVCEVAAARL